MSDCSENDSSSHLGYDSDGELSVPSTYGSEPAQQDGRKRPRQQIQGASWVLRAQITADSDLLTAGSEGDVENEERTAKINAHLQSLFGLCGFFCLLSWKGWPRKRHPAGKEGLAAATESASDF